LQLPSISAYLEAVSSIRNLRTHHAVVTRELINMELFVKHFPIPDSSVWRQELVHESCSVSTQHKGTFDKSKSEVFHIFVYGHYYSGMDIVFYMAIQ
jgi:hypothetical protein